MSNLEELSKTKSDQYVKRYFYSDGTIRSEDRYDKDGNETNRFFNSDGTIKREVHSDKDGNLTKVI